MNNYKRKINWSCSARIDCIDNDMLKKMHAAGCSAIFFGIETGSSEMQTLIRKNLNIDGINSIADECLKLGINMHASFIIGFPQESKADLNKTLMCVLDLARKGIQVQSSELTILPGTDLYKRHLKDLKFDGTVSNFSYSPSNLDELKSKVKELLK